MIDDPKISRQCSKCCGPNWISLEKNSFVCSTCGETNEYDGAKMKEAMAEIRRKIKKQQFKNPKNN